MVTHSWKITWVWDGWNSEKKIPLYTRLGTVTIEIHLIKCIIGKVQLIKDGNNFCLSCLEDQRLVALLQGSIESGDSPASGGDEEEGEQAQADNVSEPIRFEAGRSWSGRPATSYVLWQSTMVIRPGKAINGLDTDKLLNCRTCGLHHLIFLLHLKQVFCYW